MRAAVSMMKWQWYHLVVSIALVTLMAVFQPSHAIAADGSGMVIPVGRSELINLPGDMAEVMVANPEIADIHIHGATHFSVVGKGLGRTNVRVFDKDNKVMRSFDVTVTYDLPAIRKALKNFFPYERIGVELVNTNVALVGDVSGAAVADKAVRVVNEFLRGNGGSASGMATSGDTAAGTAASASTALNLLQIKTGQQVMLRVRVGELQRDTLRRLGVSLSFFKNFGNTAFQAGTNGNIAAGGGGNVPVGQFKVTGDAFGFAGAVFGTANSSIGATLDALENDGVFKLLAEPNLVALSGEKAEFLAGGEFPIPVASGSGSDTTITVQYKPFGVAVQFMPMVLSSNRIRLTVQPEVSEIVGTSGTLSSGLTVPTISARRAKTTIELAPGESFMIAGLLKDQLNNTLQHIPGLAEIPIFSALFRSTEFKRNETELVIAVTPYLVDPLASGDVKLPSDDFRPASTMENFFYGALGANGSNTSRISQTPPLEGPIGYLVD